MNAHLFKHELIGQYWIIENSKKRIEETSKRYCVIMYLGTIMCESKIHVRPPYD